MQTEPTGAPAHYLHPVQRPYKEFHEVPLGATFGDSWQWVKRSTRTAYHVEAQRVFYFRQKDIVRL